MRLKSQKLNKGFTLLELLIVISIMGLLAGMIMVSFPGVQKRARLAQALQFSDSLRGSLQMDMIGWWPLDETSGTVAKDSWFDQFDGTLNGNPQWTEGVINGALEFDGNDYVSHPTPDIDPRNGTLEAWVKPNVTHPWGLWQTHNATGQNWLDWISMFMYSSGRFYFRMGNGSSCCSNDTTFLYNDIVEAGEWMHMAFTWGGTTMKAYVNGKVVAQRTNAIFQDNVDPGARIGQGHSIGMNGLIDEVRIYSVPLPEVRIQQHYAQGLPSHPRSLVRK